MINDAFRVFSSERALNLQSIPKFMKKNESSSLLNKTNDDKQKRNDFTCSNYTVDKLR